MPLQFAIPGALHSAWTKHVLTKSTQDAFRKSLISSSQQSCETERAAAVISTSQARECWGIAAEAHQAPAMVWALWFYQPI